MAEKSEITIPRQPTFIGGCNDFLLADAVSEISSVRMENLDGSDSGALRSRPPLAVRRSLLSGLTSIDQQPRLLGLFPERFHRTVIVAITDASSSTSRVFIDDGTSSVPLDFTSPHKLSSDCDIVPILDRLYILQPGQAPLFFEWGNSALHMESGPVGSEVFPSSTTATYFQGRAWAGNRNLVFPSETVGAGEIEGVQSRFDTLNRAILVTTGEVVKILPYRNQRLLVFTTGGIESLEPSLSLSNILLAARSVVSSALGCGSKQSVQLLGEDVLWVDQFGDIRSLAKTEADEPIGVLNEPISLAIQQTTRRMRRSRLHTIRSAVWRGDYFVALPVDAPFPNEVWRYVPRSRSWHGPWIFNYDPDGATAGNRIPYFIAGMVAHRFPGDDERLYILSRTASGIVRLLSLEHDFTLQPRQDVSTPIRTRFVSRAYTGKNPEREKVISNLRIEGRFRHLPLTASMPSGATLASFKGTFSGASILVSFRADEGTWRRPSIPTLALFVPNYGPRLGTSEATLPFRLRPPARQQVNVPLSTMDLGRSIQFELVMTNLPVDFEVTALALTQEERPVSQDG